MSLLDAAERFASIDRSQVILDTKRCLHSQDQYSDCAACFSICPVDAIRVGKPPVLDTELCQSCLACLPACPIGAYHADDDVSSLLNCATHVEGEVVELLCGLHSRAEMGAAPESTGIHIRSCLAGLGAGAYAELSALGRNRIIVRTDACRACKWQSLHLQILDQTERANRFLSAWEKIDTITCMDEVESPVERTLWDAGNPPLSRRDLFRMVARQGQVAMARAMENGIAARTRQPGRDRLRLVAAASHLPVPTETSDVEGLGFASLMISESCTACGACGKACPTEALHVEKNDAEMLFSILFSAQHCIGCDVCDHVCLPDAINLDHAARFEQVFETREPVIVASGAMARCERCKALIAKHEDARYCPLCEYRRTHPFGSAMPKKIVKGSHS